MKKIIFGALLLSLSLLSSQYAHAQAKSDVVAAVSVSSLKAFEQVAGEWGTRPPAWLTKEGLQSMFRFSQNGVQTNRPAGIYIVGGTAARQRHMVALPVSRDVAPLHKLKYWAGAKPVAGDNYMVQVFGSYIKRTPNYMFAGGTMNEMKRMSEKSILGQHRSTNQVIRGLVNVTQMNAIDAQSVRQFTGLIKGIGLAGGASGTLAANTMVQMIEKDLSFIDFSVDRTSSNYDISMNLHGMDKWKIAAFAKPHFPGQVVARMDFVYGEQSKSEFMKKLLPELFMQGFTDGRKDPALATFLEKLTELLLEGEAVSFAFHQTESGMPVIYAVGQRKKAGNLAQSLDKLLQDSVKLRNFQDFIVMDNAYAAKPDKRDGQEPVVFRMHTLDREGQPAVHLEMAESGNAMLFAIAPMQGTHLNQMLPLKTAGRIAAGFEMDIYVDRLIQSAPKWNMDQVMLSGGEQTAKVKRTRFNRAPEEVLAGKLRGQRITLSAKFMTKYMQLKCRIPVKSLQMKDDIFAILDQ